MAVILIVSIAAVASTANAATQNTAPEGAQAELAPLASEPEAQEPTEEPTQAPTEAPVPSIPRITKISSVQGGVKISFTAYDGAYKYRVFTKKADNSGWKGIADVTTLSYTRKNVMENVADVYTVRALDRSGRFISGYDKEGYTFTLLSSPQLVSAQSVYDGVKISWNAVKGAPCYRVYVKNGSDWKGIGNTTSTSYLDRSVSSGSSYTYTVRPIDPADNNNTLGYYDRRGVSVSYVASPAVTACIPVQGGTKVAWDAVEGAVQYRLFYHNGASWKTIGTTSGTSMVHEAPVSGTEYIYTVRIVDGKGQFISGYNPDGWAFRYIDPPRILGVARMSADQHMYWAASPYIASYCVYRKEYGGPWQKLGQTATFSFTDKKVRNNTLYTYTLRGLDADGQLNTYYATDTRYYYNCAPADGKYTVNGDTVLFVDGYLRQGFVTVDGKTYYYNSSGTLMKNGVVGSDKDGWRYADRNGVIDMSYTGIAASGKDCWYLKNGQVDTTARIAVTYGGSQWNVLNGKARKVVTEEDKVLYRALNLVNKVTNSSMTKEQKLRAMWNYCRDAYVEKNPRIPHYHGDDWTIIYANDMLINGVGNCMSYGAEFAYLAKAIGYKDCYACHSGGHGWAEIDGLIYDVEWSRHVFKYNYYALSYDTKTDQDYKGAISAGLPWMHVRVCADYTD